MASLTIAKGQGSQELGGIPDSNTRGEGAQARQVNTDGGDRSSGTEEEEKRQSYHLE